MRAGGRFSRALVFAVAAAAATGCASILGIDKDYEDVFGDAMPDVGGGPTANPDGGGGDGTTPIDEGGAIDAPVDGPPYAPLATGDVRVYYAKTSGEVAFRTWSFASKTWSTPTVLETYAQSFVPFVAPSLYGGAESVGIVDVGNASSRLRAHAGEPGWPLAFEKVDVTPPTRAAHRAFDVASSAQSEQTIVVYGDETPMPKFRVRKAGVSSAEQALLASAPGAAAVDWVKLVAHPRTDEITLLYSDVNRLLYAAVWNGSAWSAATTLDATGLNPSEYQPFAGAYEDKSGDLLVIWSRASTCNGPADPVYYATKTAGSSSFSAYVSSDAGATKSYLAGFGPIVAASEPGTDRIAFATIEQAECCATSGCDDLGVGLWDGTQFTSMVDHDGTTTYDYNQRQGALPVAVGWLGASGTAVAVYTKPATPSTLNWEKWTPSGAWGGSVQTPVALTPATAEQASYAMVRIPSVSGEPSGNLVLLVLDAGGSLWAKLYDGASWTDLGNGAAIATDVRANLGVAMGAVSR